MLLPGYSQRMQPSRWPFSPTLLFCPIPLHAVVSASGPLMQKLRFGPRSTNYEYADPIKTRRYQLKTTLSLLLDFKREVVATPPTLGPIRYPGGHLDLTVSFSWRVMVTMNLNQSPHRVSKDEYISLLRSRGLI